MTTGALPLAGLRVADLTIITAGASATQLLADFGADVVKVESATYPDPFRHWGSGLSMPPGLNRPWDASPPFNGVNRNKRGLTLDLKQPAGREAFLKLVATSDVVAENFRRGVLERLGLGYEVLRQVKPDIILASFSSQGTTGPERGYASYGSTLDALSGLVSMTGYGPEQPVWSSNEVNYPDQIVSVFGAGVIVAGVRRRRLTGRGCHIDLSQRELVTSLIGEAVLDYAVNGRVARPRANRDSSRVPHGVYRCRGNDEWLAVAVETDEQWMALCRAIGRPDLAEDPDYATLLGRWEREAAIDEIVGEWTAGQDKHAAMRTLQAAGVPAGAVLNGAEMLDDPQLAAGGFYQLVEHPVGGLQRQRTWPFKLGRTPGAIRRPAPMLGQHSRETLRDLLGYTEGDIDGLEAAGVVGDAPVARRERSGARA